MDKHIAMLLRCIHQKRSTASLVEKGLLYHQIAKLIAISLDRDYIEYGENGGIILTNSGSKYLFEAGSRASGGGVGWIEPLENMRIPKMDLFEVYIPPRRVLRKLRKC